MRHVATCTVPPTTLDMAAVSADSCTERNHNFYLFSAASALGESKLQTDRHVYCVAEKKKKNCELAENKMNPRTHPGDPTPALIATATDNTRRVRNGFGRRRITHRTERTRFLA